MSQLVIGLGNRLRGDDGAGAEVARRVRTVPAHEVTDPASLFDMWSGDDGVIVIDAVSSGAPVGTIHRIDVTQSPLPLTSSTSSHAFGLAEVVELARSLGRLPRSVQVYGIEVGSLSPGSQMSPQVEAAVQEVVEEIDRA
jgi:hydrogenase maturation protease